MNPHIRRTLGAILLLLGPAAPVVAQTAEGRKPPRAQAYSIVACDPETDAA